MSKEYNYDKPEYNLPDSFAKDENSTNYKLLQTDKEIVNAESDNIQRLTDTLDLSVLAQDGYSDTLNREGAMLGVVRGQSNDLKYLVRIETQAMQNVSDGTRETIAAGLAHILDCDTSEIHIVSGDETGSVILKEIPLQRLITAGFTADQVDELINNFLSVGVKLSSSLYTGTFEFGSTETDYDTNKGFANTQQTIGGYFGLLN